MPAATHLPRFRGELNALGFAAGKNRGSIAQFEVTQAEFVQGLQLPRDRALVGKESDALLDRKFQDFSDVAPAPGYLKGFFTIPLALAGGAEHLHVRHKR